MTPGIIQPSLRKFSEAAKYIMFNTENYSQSLSTKYKILKRSGASSLSILS